MSISTTSNPNDYFLRLLKYEQCVYVAGVLGVISQIVANLVIIVHLGLGYVETTIKDETRSTFAREYSAIGILLLIASVFSEILLMRAVNQRRLPYLQWWITSSIVLFLFTSLMTVISGFTLYNDALWITLSFVIIVIRLPFQIHFVDMFAQVEIIHKAPPSKSHYKGVRYRVLS